MGMTKVIQAKREALEKNKAAYMTFLDMAIAIQDQVKKIADDVDRMDKLRQTIGDRVGKMDTRGVKELDDYKKSLEGVAGGSSRQIAELSKLFTRTLPTAPITELVKKQDRELSGLMKDLVQKHSGTFPKEIKVGMTFKGPKGEIVEITTLAPYSYGVKQLLGDREAKTIVKKEVLCIEAGYRYLRG